MTQDQADILITYLQALEERVNHQSLMTALSEDGVTEEELDQAARALGAIANRDYSIL